MVGVLALGAAGYALAATGRDAPSGPRTQRTFTACPTHDRRPLRSLAAGAGRTLVPGRPAALLVCRYSGVGGFPHPVGAWAFHLRSHRLLTRARAVRSLAAQLNALRPVTGAQACPNDDGEAILAVFRYGGSAPDDPVTVHLGGCGQTDNGHVYREATTLILTVLRALAPITRPDSEPYRLYTHCGIEWTRIRGTFWRAVPPLSDGSGNPPGGWGNPYQRGTLTFTGAATAVFSARPGTVTFRRTARRTPPIICS